MLRLRAAGSEVTRIWQMLVGRRPRPHRAARGPRRYTLCRPREAVATAPDRRGRRRPARQVVVFLGPDQSIEYRFTGWRFTAAKGRAAFVLAPQAGMQVIDTR